MTFKTAIHASLACLLLAAFLFPIAGWDIFWHMRVGMDILATRSFPTGDVYSYTRPGGMYVEDEWLFQVLAYEIHRLGGWNALIAAKVLLMGAGAALLYLECRALCGSHSLAALLVGTCEVAARTRMTERPDVLNLLFFPALLLLISAARRTGSSRYLLCVPPLFGAWANVHSGVTLGLFVLAGFAFADLVCHALPGFLPRASEGNPWHLIAAAAAAIPATLVNPIGTRILTFPFEVVGVHRTSEWQKTPLMAFPLFYALCLAFGAATIVCLARFKTFDLAEVSVFSLLLYLGIGHVRFLGIFAVSWSITTSPAWPGIAITGFPCRDLRFARRPPPAPAHHRRPRSSRQARSARVRGQPGWSGAWSSSRRRSGRGGRLHPARERPPAPMYNEFTFEELPLHRLYPTYKVFIEQPAKTTFTTSSTRCSPRTTPGPSFRVLDRYGYLRGRDAARGLHRATAENGELIPVGPARFTSRGLPGRSSAGTITTSSSPVNPRAGWIARLEPTFDPEDWRLGLGHAVSDPAYRQAAIRDMDQKIADDPSCWRARELREMLAAARPGGG
ncbi:MAG: hypothetical protein U0166_06600 [Acidobacteriota bacterium]